MFSRHFCFSLNEYKPIEKMLKSIPREWRKLDVAIVCDVTGRAYRHSISAIEEFPYQEVFMGHITLTDKMLWNNLDRVVLKKFNRFLNQTDRYSALGLSSESIHCYKVHSGMREPNGLVLPQQTPFELIAGPNAKIRIFIKGAKQQESVDALAFSTLLPKELAEFHIDQIKKKRVMIFQSQASVWANQEMSFIVGLIASFLDHIPSLNRQRLSSDEVLTFGCNGRSSNVYQLRVLIDDMKVKCRNVRLRNEALRNPGLYYPPVALPHVVVIENLQCLTTNLEEIVQGFMLFRKPIMEIPYLLGTFT